MEIISYHPANGSATVRLNDYEAAMVREGALGGFSVADEITKEVERESLRLREDEPLRYVTAIVPMPHIQGVQIVE